MPVGQSISQNQKTDYEVSGSGSLFILTPLNAAAKENLEAGVGSEAQRWAGGIVVEHRYIGPLVQQLQEEGWSVR